MKKYIAIFAAYYLPYLGGIERYNENFIKELISLGYSPILITSNYNNKSSFEETDGLIIIRLPVYNIFKNRYPIIKKNKLEKELIKKLDNYDIRKIIVNTRFHLTSHVGAFYGYKRGIDTYLIEHGSNYVTLHNKLIDFVANRYEDFLTYKIKNKIKAFYGVSKSCSNWLKHFNIKSSGEWYNSINDLNLSKKKHKNINFMYAGRLIEQKGVDNILISFSKLEKKYNNIHLFIAGDGPRFDEYKSKYNSKNISFLGKLNYEELLNYYKITDIFLYPPMWPEGMPSSILESGMMKCAIIATKQGGIKEIIKNNENGLLINNNELYKSMEKLLLNKDLRVRYSKEIYKTIKNKFSWDITVKKILKDIGE